MQAWFTQYPFAFIEGANRYEVPLSMGYGEVTDGTDPVMISYISTGPSQSSGDTYVTKTARGVKAVNNTEPVYYYSYAKTRIENNALYVDQTIVMASKATFAAEIYRGTEYNTIPMAWSITNRPTMRNYTYNNKTIYYAYTTLATVSTPTEYAPVLICETGAQELTAADYTIADNGIKYYAWLIPYGENQYVNDPYNRPPQPETDKGGHGSWDNSSDTIEVDPLPAGLWGQGFVSVYVPTVAELASFASEIWSSSNVTRFNDIFPNGLTSGIVDCFTIPIQPDTTTAGYICMGGEVLTITQAAILANRFKIVDFGNITLTEYFGAFADYTSTKIAIYIPYIGWEELAPEMCINATINLQYKVDCLTGDFVAIITTNRTDKFAYQGVSYTFNGNCATRIPLTARTGAGTYDYVASAISGLTTVAGGLMTGNPVAVAGGIMSTANSMLSMNDKHTFALKGGFSGAKGQLTSQRPYLVINRPVMEDGRNNNYFNVCGAPSNDYATIGACASGAPTYVKAFECVIDNANFAGATDSEKNKIYTLLKGGVIV